MKKLLAELKKFPVVPIFFAVLLLYTAADCCVRNKERDEYENRRLAQFPAFSWKSLLANEWTGKYETYMQDQFLGRHGWIVAKSFAETLLGRTENNGVVYGKDGYQFAKFTALADTVDGSTTQLAQNTEYLTRFIGRHPDSVTLLLAPSASNILSDKLPAGVPLLDENPEMDRLFAAVEQAGAAVIDLRDAFTAHREEYLYYRTDHHWTTEGAFLAYQTAAPRLGTGGFDPAAHIPVTVEGFTGTNYNKSLKFGTAEDTLIYYGDLENTLTVKELRKDGTEISAEPGGLYDLTALNGRDKYAAFLRGNHGYSTVTGSRESTDGGQRRILVIKDSYANCFVPFLTADYDQIDVVDLRYWKSNVETLIDLYDYDDILVLYNFQTFSAESSLFYLNAMLGK